MTTQDTLSRLLELSKKTPHFEKNVSMHTDARMWHQESESFLHLRADVGLYGKMWDITEWISATNPLVVTALVESLQEAMEMLKFLSDDGYYKDPLNVVAKIEERLGKL